MTMARTRDFRDPLELFRLRASPHLHRFHLIRNIRIEYTLFSGYDWSTTRNGPVILAPAIFNALPRLRHLRVKLIVRGLPPDYWENLHTSWFVDRFGPLPEDVSVDVAMPYASRPFRRMGKGVRVWLPKLREEALGRLEPMWATYGDDYEIFEDGREGESGSIEDSRLQDWGVLETRDLGSFPSTDDMSFTSSLG